MFLNFICFANADVILEMTSANTSFLEEQANLGLAPFLKLPLQLAAVSCVFFFN